MIPYKRHRGWTYALMCLSLVLSSFLLLAVSLHLSLHLIKGDNVRLSEAQMIKLIFVPEGDDEARLVRWEVILEVYCHGFLLVVEKGSMQLHYLPSLGSCDTQDPREDIHLNGS